ncbi:hypothetical protein K435DRAFT_860096 [Dendrothele bispora CBS 962.96]|uniref:Uncharacterized protein n=1 Tax=Dendrothele bispora (strain CBS 962.96) TaxID=1314807 RepID=A0A4S8LYZ4_DENBC|nr:hypothetical protein K435DRAFT_860096 [Dendrothele bispora CBS 962.96]
MANKKRKLSGLSRVELLQAYKALNTLKKSFLYEDVDDETQADEQADKGAERWMELLDKHLEGMLTLIESRLAEPNSFSFPNMDFDILKEELDITSATHLTLKSDYDERIQKSALLGQDKYMSSENMYRHLNMLENLVPKTSEASARLWIDTLFFRSSAMVPPGKSMILNLEYAIPSTTLRSSASSTKLLGNIDPDYTAMLIDSTDAHIVFTSTQIPYIKQHLPTGFFVTEANPDGRFLDIHIPQAITEMYACARTMQKDILRGALTNGLDWIFLILYLNRDKKGGSFRQSGTLKICSRRSLTGHATVLEPEPDAIAGILSYWIENSFQDIGEDDWFQI